jgi:hypothetical protein
VVNFTYGSSFTNHLLHLKGKEVFGFVKQLADCLPCADKDSHHPNHMNFSRPRVSISASKPDFVEDVHIQQSPSSSSDSMFLLFRGGLKLKAHLY